MHSDVEPKEKVAGAARGTKVCDRSKEVEIYEKSDHKIFEAHLPCRSCRAFGPLEALDDGHQ
jgi:hypothetical protein